MQSQLLPKFNYNVFLTLLDQIIKGVAVQKVCKSSFNLFCLFI